MNYENPDVKDFLDEITYKDKSNLHLGLDKSDIKRLHKVGNDLSFEKRKNQTPTGAVLYFMLSKDNSKSLDKEITKKQKEHKNTPELFFACKFIKTKPRIITLYIYKTKTQIHNMNREIDEIKYKLETLFKKTNTLIKSYSKTKNKKKLLDAFETIETAYKIFKESRRNIVKSTDRKAKIERDIIYTMDFLKELHKEYKKNKLNKKIIQNIPYFLNDIITMMRRVM